MIKLLSVWILLLSILQTQIAAQSGRNRPPAKTPAASQPAPEKPETTYATAEEAEELSDTATLKIDATLVTVPVVVSDYTGRYVPFLKPSDFQLTEDGVSQEISFFAAERVPFDVAIVMDTSGSIHDSLPDIQESAIRFVNELNEEDRVTIIEFNSRVRVLTELTSDRAEIQRSIRRTNSGGGTKLYDGLYEAAKRMSSVDRRKALILLTDGEDTESRIRERLALDAVVECGALVYVIQFPDSGQFSGRTGMTFPPTFPPTFPSPGGTGSYPDSTFLKLVVEMTGGDIYRAGGRSGLPNIWRKIADELRNVYVLGYYPSNPVENGGTRRIQLSLRKKEPAKLRYKSSYNAKRPETKKDKKSSF